MSPRARVIAIVSVLAAAAAAVAVGTALLQSPGDGAGAGPARPQGAPPLLLDLGFRDDSEARDLREAERLLDDGDRAGAATLFARHDSVDAELGAAVSAWPDGTLARLRALAEEHPRSALVRVNLGLALLWTGQAEAARQAWREAIELEPDTPAAVRAGDLLHPNSPRGLPTFVPAEGAPQAIVDLPPAEQLAALERAAAEGGTQERLLHGVALQRVGRPESAQRVFDTAVAADPDSVEAQVAAAVARFRKGAPGEAFSRLGPLASRHGDVPTVRFHLGLLLLWLGELEDARRQLELAVAAGPESPLGREARRFLDRLDEAG